LVGKKPVSQNYLFIAILCAKMSRVNKVLKEIPPSLIPILEVTLLTASDAFFDHFRRLSVTDKKNPVTWSYPKATDIGSPSNSYRGIFEFVQLFFKTIFLYNKMNSRTPFSAVFLLRIATDVQYLIFFYICRTLETVNHRDEIFFCEL